MSAAKVTLELPLELAPPPPPEAVGGKARRWSAGHYVTLVSLFAASCCGMFGCGPGTMSLAFFGMSKDKPLGFSAAAISSLLALGSAGFSAGKLVGGPLSDLLGGKATLTLVLSAMGACQVVMSRSSSLRVMAVAWFITRAAHALTWCGVMLEGRPWFMGNGLSGALSILTSSCPTGAFSGAFFGGRLLARNGWRGVTQRTGVLMLATSALQLGALRSPPQKRRQGQPLRPLPTMPTSPLRQPRQPRQPRRRDHRQGSCHKQLKAARTILGSGRLWAVYACSALITPTLDLPTLLPMYLDTLAMDAASIGWVGSLFSLAAVPAVLGGGWLHQRLQRHQRTALYAPLLCVSASGLLALSTVQQQLIPGKTAGSVSVWASKKIVLPALVAIMSGIAPSFYIPTYDYIMRFGGPYTGTLTGLCDFFGGVFCTLFYSLYPRLIRQGGWPLVFRVYGAMNCVAAAAIALFCVMEARDPLLRSPFEEDEEEDDGGHADDDDDDDDDGAEGDGGVEGGVEEEDEMHHVRLVLEGDDDVRKSADGGSSSSSSSSSHGK